MNPGKEVYEIEVISPEAEFHYSLHLSKIYKIYKEEEAEWTKQIEVLNIRTIL